MINSWLLFFLVAVVEWVIAILSSRLIAKGKMWATVFIIFFEQLLGFWVLFAFVDAVNRWDLAVAYSLGAAVGSGISMFLTRDLQDGGTPDPGQSLPKVGKDPKASPRAQRVDKK
ncbi:MAG: hypothetical protein AAB486_02705 [Patescibacteria group bacterium]